MSLKKIQIQRFRSIDSVEMALTPITVIVGQNESGKTNVLSAIRFAQSFGAGQIPTIAPNDVVMRGSNADMVIGLSFELPIPQLGLGRAALEYEASFRPSASGASMVAEKLRFDGETWFDFSDGRWKVVPEGKVPRRTPMGTCLALFKRDPISRAAREFFLRGFTAYSPDDHWMSNHPSSNRDYVDALAGLVWMHPLAPSPW